MNRSIQAEGTIWYHEKRPVVQKRIVRRGIKSVSAGSISCFYRTQSL